MPALVKSSVGSCAGTSGEERTTVWPFRRKYTRNRWRSSLPVTMSLLAGAIGIPQAAGSPIIRGGYATGGAWGSGAGPVVGPGAGEAGDDGERDGRRVAGGEGVVTQGG